MRIAAQAASGPISTRRDAEAPHRLFNRSHLTAGPAACGADAGEGGERRSAFLPGRVPGRRRCTVPRMADPDDDDLDPSAYRYWRAHGYRGRPPWRRGYQWLYFAISIPLLLGLAVVFVLAANGRL